eukprot:3044434-Alexandrium_andersonii.AAC.1
MSASLVGSEMCIRDRGSASTVWTCSWAARRATRRTTPAGVVAALGDRGCLLYTSDAADDM